MRLVAFEIKRTSVTQADRSEMKIRTYSAESEFQNVFGV